MLATCAGRQSKIRALEAGADACLTWPAEPAELLSQVKALLRRRPPDLLNGIDQPLACGALEVWPDQGQARLNDTELRLSRTEFELLCCLARNPGRVFSRRELLQQVWGYDFAGETRTVDAHIYRLRRKIEPDPDRPQVIQTVRGFGYRLAPAPELNDNQGLG